MNSLMLAAVIALWPSPSVYAFGIAEDLRVQPAPPDQALALPDPNPRHFWRRDTSARRLTSADYSHHIRQLRARLPASAAFIVVVQPPFVIIGDEPAATVRRRATDTVKFAVDRLKRDYFKRDPPDIVDIWLFKDRDSYERHARELFNETPTTPFGSYSSQHKALIMNIATGGGTLVHEIVHPFMRANFPDCPPLVQRGTRQPL